MDKKNLMTQVNDSAGRFTIQDLPTEFIELSNEALSEVCGGINVNLSHFTFHGRTPFLDRGHGYPEHEHYSLSSAADPAMTDPEFGALTSGYNILWTPLG